MRIDRKTLSNMINEDKNNIFNLEQVLGSECDNECYKVWKCLIHKDKYVFSFLVSSFYIFIIFMDTSSTR